MTEATIQRGEQNSADALSSDTLFEILKSDPAVGVCVMDSEGSLHFANTRYLELYTGQASEAIEGGHLRSYMPEAWVNERLEHLRHRANGSSVIFRGMYNGRSLTTTCHPIGESYEDPRRFLCLTVAGDPADHGGSNGTPVLHSTVNDLGELAVLTRREIEVLAMIGDGMSRAAIADALNRSTKTIDKHLESISGKLRVNNRVGLAKIAHRAGLRRTDADSIRSRRTPS